MANVNDNYFDGAYKEIWRSYIPNELTGKETDFMIQQFKLEPGSKVLDLMCGYGRHALALGRNGIQVTAVDNLADYIEEIRRVTREESLPVDAVKAGVLDYQPEQNQYDLVICMGNSLNFFAAPDTQAILQKISKALKPGGHVFINTWSLAEIAIKQFSRQSWEWVDDLKVLHEAVYLFHPARIETETIIINPDGKEERKQAVDYIFSINEFESLLANAGLKLETVYSVPGRKKFAVGDARAYLQIVRA